MSESIYLRIGPESQASNEDNLLYIQGSLEELARREAWPEGFIFKVNLVLEELGLNILTHGGENNDRRPEIEIVLTSDDESLTIEVSDDGYPFNPLEDAAQPDVNAVIEDRSIGGLGLHLVRTLMDDLRYSRDEGKNRLTIVARRD